MNYYEFLYRWEPYRDLSDAQYTLFHPGYFWFDCTGVVCKDCGCWPYIKPGSGCGVPRFVFGWDRILAEANKLLEEGWLYK